MANMFDIKIDLPSDAELVRMFNAVPQLERHDVMGATTAAGAKVVSAKARELAPRSTERDRNKRSAKQKASANWNTQLHTTIAVVTRRGNTRAFSIVGPKHPDGNKVWFNFSRKGSRKHILWGRDTGRVYTNKTNFIKRAFDETRDAQLAAMKAALTKKVADMVGASWRT